VPGQVPATTLATADIKVDLIEYGHPGVDDRRLNQLLSAAMLFPRQAAPHHVIGASQQGRPRGGGRRVPRDDDRLVLWFGRLRRPTPHPTARAALFAPAHYHRTHRAPPCATARVSFRLLQVVRKDNRKLAYVVMPEADREMPELQPGARSRVWPFARLAAPHPSSLPQAAAWIKSDGIVVDNPELMTARKVCRATYYELTHRVLLYLL